MHYDIIIIGGGASGLMAAYGAGHLFEYKNAGLFVSGVAGPVGSHQSRSATSDDNDVVMH